MEHTSVETAHSEIKKTTPAFSFGGKGVSRDPADRIKTQFVPGPGAYNNEQSLGSQQDSRRATATISRFPVADRDAAAKVFAGTPTLEFVCSPGPGAYDVKSRVGRQGAPSFSFAQGRPQKGKQQTQPEDKRANPGPGEYNHLSELSDRYCTFGSSKRAEYDHQYVGPGMPTPADSRCQASYVGNGSMLGSQISRPSSPAFSFGKKSSTVPRRAAEPRPMTTPSGLGSTFTDEGADRPTSMSGQRRKTVKYDWLRGGSKQQTQKNTYQRAVDGADMPRANEFSKQPAFAFGKDERFSDRIYIPHKPVVRSGTTPGPIYELPEGLGQAPSYSFPKVSDRTHPDARRAEKEKRPGPGSYNLRLEHRVESLLSEAESSMMMDTNSLGHTAMAPDDIMEGAFTGAPDDSHAMGKSSTLSQMTSMLSAANELGLKFGDIPNASTQPAFSFGTGDRESRSKVYDQSVEKEFVGRYSPGPCTALREMTDGRVQSPQYSFGGKNLQRNPQLKQSSEVGPAQFGTVHAVGKQIASVNATAPDFSFGNADRAQVSKLYVPGAAAGDTNTPGPIYEINHAVGKQLSSEKDNAPIFTFGSSKREHVGKVYMPQSVGKKNRPDEFMRAVPSQ
jgi:hypothetical protein